MNYEKAAMMVASVLVLGLAACSPNEGDPAAADKPMAGMPMTATPMADAPAAAPPAATVSAPIMGTGKVTAIDVAAGTVTLDHEPIAALNWSKMTMAFTTTDPSQLNGVAVGDTVSFEIKSQSESAVITQLQKQ